MNEIKRTSIQIPNDTLIKIKAMAVKKGKTQNTIINDLIIKGLENTGKDEEKIKARIINNELPKPKTNSKRAKRLEDMVGVIKVDKEIDPLQLKNSIYLDKLGL
ncbi:MAG: hypothetical protein LBT66_07630 [Methanobrevibacter sp.]|jgi:predicted DNA-binding protein|nr:hypothetical protein [Candidatus Methanovirga meridionalis]